MSSSDVKLDPLNSPHPIPWNWILATQQAAIATATEQYYRSQSLRSPDGDYAAYSRIHSQLQPQFTESQISSILFVEHLAVGGLQTLTSAAPLAATFQGQAEAPPPGAISITIPIAWSADSQWLLARSFESLFGTDLASDYALVWNRSQGQSWTIAPSRLKYDHAVLLGWSEHYPGQVLFRVYAMDGDPLVVRVALDGDTLAAGADQAQVHGQAVNHVWAGPQFGQ